MYETHSQDEHQNRGKAILYFSVTALIIFLSFIFLIMNHLTKYLLFVFIAFIIWGLALWVFLLDWRIERRITSLFPENKKWYPVKPRRHTNQRLPNREYSVQRIGTTLHIRTVYFKQGSSECKCTITRINYETFKSNYVLMKEKTAQ